MEDFYKIRSRFGDFPNYKISRTGIVLCWDYKRSGITGILKQHLHTDGYPMVALVDDKGIRHTIKTHTVLENRAKRGKQGNCEGVYSRK